MTRSVRDAAIMLQAMARYDKEDPAGTSRDLPHYVKACETTTLRDYTVGVASNVIDRVRDRMPRGLDLPDEEIAAFFEGVGRLRQLGATVNLGADFEYLPELEARADRMFVQTNSR